VRQRATRLTLHSRVKTIPDLSIYGSAMGAYDLRIPPGSPSTLPLVQVRRSSDNAQLDIGASEIVDANGNRWLDEAQLSSFVGSASGYVSKWYDLSPFGLHATQTTAPDQPRIANAGVIDRLNGKPTIVFSGAQKLGTAGFNASGIRNFMGSVVARDDSGGAFIERVFVVQATTGAADYLGVLGAVLVSGYSSGTRVWAFRNGLDLAFVTSTGGQAFQANSWFDATTHNMQRNAGTPASFTFAQQYLGNAVQLWIGGSRTNDGPLTGAVSAAAFYPVLPDATGRSAISGSQMTAYAI
jgi:hypothetical protein